MKKLRERLFLGGVLFLCSFTLVLAFRSFGPLNVHRWITADALSNEITDKESLRKIQKENTRTDRGDKLKDPSLHFDSENFQVCIQKLTLNMNKAVEFLGICDKDQAIVHIGEALHALQDFYSHSNWVEMNLLDRNTVIPLDIPIFTGLIALGPDGVFVPGTLTADPNFQDTCTDDPPNPPATVITSGYFPDDTKPPNKCSHKETNKDYIFTTGSHSSLRGAFLVNGNRLFDFAFDVAVRHTQALWQDFKQAFILRFGQQQGTDFYNILIKKQINVAFTIDVSGSMVQELPAIKAKVTEWVNSLLASPVSPKLSLVTFQNFIVFEGTTCSTSTFLGWVDGLTAVAGGGCGESSITAALRAADLVGKDGIVVLATDEPPNEGAAEKEKLKKKSVKIYTIWERFDCSPSVTIAGEGRVAAGSTPLGSEVYAEIAAATGGLSFPSLADLDLAMDVILETTTPRLYDIALVEGTVSPPTENVVNVPADSTVERLDLLLTSMEFGSHTLEVRRPDGTVVAPTDPDATFVSAGTFHSVRITGPPVGTWTMGITGHGAYQASAMGISDIALFDVSFLRFEDVGDSLPRISTVQGSLNPGETFDVEIDLLGEVGTVSFDLVLPDGSLIEPLTTTEDLGGVGIFVAQYTPTSPINRFLVRAAGTDTTGAAFQRILRRSFAVSPIAVRPPDSQTSQSGCNLTYTFEVENFGAPDTFSIEATSDSNFAISLSVTSLILGTGQIGFVDAVVTIPAPTPILDDELIVVVTSTTDANNTNLASVATRIESGVDCNCNGTRDEQDIAVGNSFDCNSNGAPDECEEEVFKLTASDAGANDIFGISVSLDGDLVVLGARFDYHSGLILAGSAYVFRREGTAWVEEAKLIASDAFHANDFGIAVSLDGDLTVVGAMSNDHSGLDRPGAAYVFRREGTAWVEEAKLIASDAAEHDFFGGSVSLDGNVVVVTGGGAAYVFRRDAMSWLEEAKLTASDSVAGEVFFARASIDGDVVVVGARSDDHSGLIRAGSAYVFRREGTAWVEEAKLIASDAAAGDEFGGSVSLDGDLVLVGAIWDDHSAGTDAGSVYVFRREGENWVEEAKLTASDAAADDHFGSVSLDVDLALVGASSDSHPGLPDAGSAYLFRRQGTTWIEEAKFTAPDADWYDAFGARPSINGHFAIVGAFSDDHSGLVNAGSAYVFPLPDCNANGNPDACDITQGPSVDCNTNGVPDECDISREVSGDCDTNGVPDECDIAAGTSPDDNGNGIPDECEVEPLVPAPAPHDILKNRYISIDPRGATGINPPNLHIRVMVVSSLVNGQAGNGPWWAAQPDAACISLVTTTKPVVEPDWTGCDTAHLTGCPIIPTTTYALAAEADGALSADALFDTQAKPGVKWHCDCVGFFTGTEWTVPNGQTSIDDVVAASKTFQNPSATPGCGTPPCNATHTSVTDVVPNLPGGPQINKIVNSADVFAIIQGFQGLEYPGPDLTQCP